MKAENGVDVQRKVVNVNVKITSILLDSSYFLLILLINFTMFSLEIHFKTKNFTQIIKMYCIEIGITWTRR